MSTKSGNKNLPLSFFIIIMVTCTIIITCTRDDNTQTGDRESLTRAIVEEISADTLQVYIAWLEGMGTRFALADNHRDVAMQILSKFRMIGYSNSRLDSFMLDRIYNNIRYQQWQYNVIAELTGSTSPDSVCIVGAHYDDNLISGDPFLVDPGANDNASGVAAALELARVLKKKQFSPKNTIEFIAFGAEELGLYGSKAYSDQSVQGSKKIRMMINNDMIAYEPVTNPSEWVVNIVDYNNSHDLRNEAERMCLKFTSLAYINDNTYNKQSDSYPFFVNGYEALFFFSDVLDPGYHSLTDRSVNCNFLYCREIVKISCALLVYNN